MRRDDPGIEHDVYLLPRRGERPRLVRAMAACLLLGAAFVGCSAGPTWTPVHDAESSTESHISTARLAELQKADAEALGREALTKVGYARLIELARQAGFVTRKTVTRAAPAASNALAMGGAVPMDEVIEVFTKYAVAAGATSQLDSPLPGPADVAALGILAIGLLHVGGLVAEELLAGSSSPPVATTAPPVPPPLAASATSTPTAAPAPTVTAPPIAGTGKKPGQTCTDARLRELEKQKAAACAPKWTCSDPFEKLGRPDEKLLTCPELLARLAIGEACLAARKLVQTECFAGSPEKGHEDKIKDIEDGVSKCNQKVTSRGCR